MWGREEGISYVPTSYSKNFRECFQKGKAKQQQILLTALHFKTEYYPMSVCTVTLNFLRNLVSPSSLSNALVHTGVLLCTGTKFVLQISQYWCNICVSVIYTEFESQPVDYTFTTRRVH